MIADPNGSYGARSGRAGSLFRTSAIAIYIPGRRRSGSSDKADMMIGPNAAMRCPLLLSEIWPLSGEEGSTADSSHLGYSWSFFAEVPVPESIQSLSASAALARAAEGSTLVPSAFRSE